MPYLGLLAGCLDVRSSINPKIQPSQPSTWQDSSNTDIVEWCEEMVLTDGFAMSQSLKMPRTQKQWIGVTCFSSCIFPNSLKLQKPMLGLKIHSEEASTLRH